MGIHPSIEHAIREHSECHALGKVECRLHHIHLGRIEVKQSRSSHGSAKHGQDAIVLESIPDKKAYKNDITPRFVASTDENQGEELPITPIQWTHGSNQANATSNIFIQLGHNRLCVKQPIQEYILSTVV